MVSLLERHLQAVSKALQLEQEALLARDADALDSAVRAKQESLSHLWTWMANADADALVATQAQHSQVLHRLKETNETNGRLMAARAAEVSQSLQTLHSGLGNPGQRLSRQALYRPTGVVDFQGR